MFYIYKFRISDKSWTSFKISVPEANMNASLQKIVACNGKLYAVITSQQAVLLEVKEATKAFSSGEVTERFLSSVGPVSHIHICY
jgi:hypothetical protein